MPQLRKKPKRSFVKPAQSSPDGKELKRSVGTGPKRRPMRQQTTAQNQRPTFKDFADKARPTKKVQKIQVRLNKYLADCGVASRRTSDEWIEEGRVTVNGRKVFELGIKIDPQQDVVKVDGRLIRVETQKLYLAFHKPASVLTSTSDPQGRPTVLDYMSQLPVRVFPVGRLDWDTEGLLLLTNDGDFAQQVSHPASEVTKTYLVKVDGHPTTEKLQKLLRGVSIIGGKVAARHIERFSQGSEKYDWVKIVITEGKNRQVRQMFAKIGFDVLKLQRVAIGQLRLGHLRKGFYKVLNAQQMRKIFVPDLPGIESANEQKKRHGKRRGPRTSG